jgi:uncharacterized protein YacL
MLIELIILILGIPVGLLIAWMCKDELKQGFRWFRMLVILSLVLALFFWLYGLGYIALTCGFIAIVSLISVIKAK